ncbi:cyclin-dependent protein serine/threonine kinase inhibiting protein FAR1 NDAI_0B00160 [Naumovozyma dairenensis CBS 421]|uniref:RING-type domain-containing protein n=1 Tax=Naumovozyma dairenensis (strain ATCC 10597 / BCRC 20456 / CBS 421 / NBRC 0211 / NRRL Y-12639) TaxID=1071378 RepID=G0W5I9_NAUDC|nr:hypothetical protein NDAI_0B00160 [Naumovozyma dairenensis CBS 421]CCD23050.1 hypothetical protein NDAI_0B00160 [Naumovozyma dairenensis CBS 421]
MQLTTPTRFAFDKRVHSPPSIERENSKSSPSKFLRSLSGKAFRNKTPNLKLKQNDTFQIPNTVTPSSTLRMSKRQNVPKPLDLSKPLSPPPSLQKSTSISSLSSSNQKKNSRASLDFSLDSLNSPVNIFPSRYPKNLTSSLLRETISANSTLNTNDNIVICTDTNEDPYLEEDSPTYLSSLRRNVKTTNSGPKKYIGEKCSMCEEMINYTFQGEKVLELTCNHISHYECYLTILDSIYFNEKFPDCKICHKMVKPKDDELLQEMGSKILTGLDSNQHKMDNDITMNIETGIGPTQEQWLNLNSARGGSGSFGIPQFTPRDQVIHTADISSNGFRTPLLSSTNDAVFSRHPVQNTELFNHTLEDEQRQDIDNGLDYELNIFLAPDDIKMDCTNKGHQEFNPEDEVELRNRINQYFESKECGSIIMIRRVKYSTDGEQWTDSIIYFYENYILLFDCNFAHNDLIEKKLLGKIPMDQLYKVTEFNSNELLLDLKSTVLPEVYLQFPSVFSETLSSKWKYYLEKINNCDVKPIEEGCFPTLNQLTVTAWDIIPISFIEKINQLYSADQISKPWEIINRNVPLEVIICLNLSCAIEDEQDKYQLFLREALATIRSNLNKEDKFGLVLVGKDGSGNIGEYGTFIGTIENEWDGWDDIIDNMTIIKKEVFIDSSKELLKMLEAGCKIACTSDNNIPEDGGEQKVVKQMIILRSSNEEPIFENEKETKKLKRFEDQIRKDYQFNILTISVDDIANDYTAKFESIINELHRSLA